MADKTRLASLPHGSIKSLVASGVLEGQRRQATVLFADMAAYTPLAERLGEEKTYLLMQRVLQAMSEAVHSHEGTVQELTGDGLMAVFGVPVAAESAPIEACKAAIDIQSRMLALEDSLERELGLRPKYRIGIHTGPLVVGKVGDDLHVELTALGDTVNLASRLQSEASPGSILLSAATHELVEGFFETKFVGERLIKGKSIPQRVFELGCAKGDMSRFDVAVHRGLTPLIGRAQELQRLRLCWEQARAGNLRIVNLTGDAGIGKSRLAFEFRKELGDSAFFLQGNCTPSGQASPFRPFISMVRTTFRIGDQDSPGKIQDNLCQGLAALGLDADDTLPYLLNLLGQVGDDSAVHRLPSEVVGLRTRNVLSALLRERCRRSPVVMLIEDLHWADTASQDWVLRIAEADRELPLLIVAAFRPHYRPPWANLPGVVSLTLERLSDEGTLELLQKRIGISTVPPELARLAVAKTQGNPLFTEEITNYLIDRGQIRKSGAEIFYEKAVEPTLPITLENLLLERFDRLEEGSRVVLEAASVVGPTFSRDLVSQVTGLDGTVVQYFTALENKDLIFRERGRDRYRFKHALVQDAIYNRLLTPARKELHEKVARAIEGKGGTNLNEFVNTLADHYSETDLADKTVHYMTLAGVKSLQVYSLEEAERRFRRVIDLIESTPGCADDFLLADVLLKLARVYYYKGEFYGIISIIERYLPRLAALGDKRRYSRLLFELGYAYVFSARGPIGRKFLEQALALGEELGDDECVGYACLGLMYFHLFWREANDETRLTLRTLTNRVTTIASTLDDVWLATKCLNCRWGEAFFLSRFADARELCLDLFELTRTTNDPRPMGFGYWQMAITNLHCEQPAEAIENARQSLATALAPIDRLSAHSAEGGAFALLGRPQEAFAVLGEVRRRSEAGGYVVLVMLIDVFYGASMSLTGELAAGVRWIHEAIRRIETWGNPYLPALGYMVLGEIYLQIGTSPEKPPLRVLFKNLGFVVTQVPFARLKARRHLEEAIRRCRIVGMPGHLARCLLDMGMLHKNRNRNLEARACFDEALAVAQTVRAENIVVKVKAVLASLDTRSES